MVNKTQTALPVYASRVLIKEGKKTRCTAYLLNYNPLSNFLQSKSSALSFYVYEFN